MPHITLEYSDNILERPSSKDILKTLNELVSENFDININKFKARVVPHVQFVVSDGSNNQSFVHLEIAILDGRSDGFYSAIGESIHAFLKDQFKETIEKLACSITVEVRQMSTKSYVRESFGAI